MTIIERNFYRLLRAGAFGTEEQIEPLSAWKWNRLFQMSEMHDVTAVVYKGIERCGNQFFVQVPEQLLKQWEQATSHATDEENDLLTADHLTNPILNHKLQNILDDEDSNTETRTALLHLLGTSRFIMNAGVPVKRIMELGLFLRQSANRIDFTTLQEWIERLQMGRMAGLTAVMMVKLLHFSPEELPFMQPSDDKQMERQMHDLLHQKNSHGEEWYFSQGKDIFIHTSNSTAMLWHVRRSAKYFKYYPSETITNFFSSFAHSLSHIEE
ncbi:MAG: hypothetical protein IJ551_08640 [Prevotella sp.]|nr:hypothetical protein [Prevotella sp.]